MPKQSASRYVLLGLLDWEPVSGYDIKKIVEHDIRDFWHESYGNIYPTLQKFIKDGLAKKSVQRRKGKPDRFVYHITPAGRKELVEWLESPFETRRARDEFLAKFIFGHLVPKETNIKQLELYRRKREERLQWYRENEAVLKKDRLKSRKQLLGYLAVRQGVYVLEARLKWCDEVLAALKKYKGD